MKKLLNGLSKCGADLVLLGGAVAVSVGAGMIYFPAGLIAGGVLAIIGAALSSLGGGDDT